MAHALANPTSTSAHPRRRHRAPPTAEPGAAVRAAAARVLTQVLEQGRSLTAALAPHSEDASAKAQLPARDLPLLRELCFGVLRSLPRLDALSDCLLQRPLKARDQDLRCLLRIGLYQLDALALPEHAAVAATVGASANLDKPWARGLLNATLRRFVRERAELCASIEQDEAARTLFPPWLLARLQTAWPEHWQQLIAASNERAPMFLRVNRLRIGQDAYREQLHTAGIDASPLADCPDGLQLHAPMPVSQLPGYREGLVSVQDAGAQHAAALLGAEPGQRVLDACAAPGNKTAHLQELAGNQLKLWALDHDSSRLQSLATNLARLTLHAEIHQADATQQRGDWAEQDYDRILLDAPCSGTGVIRRHPDIKWLRRDQDIAALADTQARLLDALWPLLRPRGEMLYVTCSLLPEENAQQIAAFLARHPDAQEAKIPVDLGLECQYGRQRLPSTHGSDGFFFARLVKE